MVVFSMEWGYLAVLLLSVACGYLGGAVRSLVLHRGQLALSYRVQDLEQRNLTTVNREKSKRRWEKTEAESLEEDEFLKSLPRTNGRGVERYANDPPPSYAP
jgi:hypothetical protein